MAKSYVNLNTTWGPGFARIESDDVAGTVTIQRAGAGGVYENVLTVDQTTGDVTVAADLSVTGAVATLGAFTASEPITTPGVQNTAAETDLAGTTAGNAYWVQDGTGTVKRVVVALAGYENTTATAQTIAFPVAFTKQASIVSQPASFGATVTTTELTLPVSMAAVVNGVIVVQGI